MRFRRRLARQVRYASPRWALGAIVVIVVVAGAVRALHPHGAQAETAAQLRSSATTFNADYSANRPAAVYAYFDAASKKVISQSAYVKRHTACPDAPGAATIGVVRNIGKGWWTVDYSIGGVGHTDYWTYVDGRFEFDLPRSNPSAVPLYRSSFASYAKAVGCHP